MRHRLCFAGLVAAVMFAAACTQSQVPASPSEFSSLNERGAASSSQSWATMSQNRQSQVVDWSCLTTGVGCSVLPLQRALGQDSPNAPANLAFSVNGATVVLTWSPPGPGPTTNTYVLEAGTAPGLSNIVNFNTGSTATTFTATNVPAGTYYVRVRASNVDGPGEASNEVTIVVGSVSCTPSAPPSLSASAAGSTVTLTWSTVSGAIAFIIEAGSTPGASDITSFDTGSAATSFTVNSVPNGTYYVRARVRTSCGTSGVSNEVTLIVGTPSPTSVTGTWVGLAPDGWIFPPDPRCGTEEFDMTLDLSQTGTNVTGTFTNRVRVSRCKTIGRTTSAPLMTGTVGSGTIVFTIHGGGTDEILTFRGTFTATRMTGTATPSDDPTYTVRFAVNRQ